MQEKGRSRKERNLKDVLSGREKGLTLSELLVLAAITVCAGLLLLPVLFRASEGARRVECADNLRMIGIAAIAYSGDFGGYLPPTAAGLSPPTRRIRSPRGSDYAAKPGLGKLLGTEHLRSACVTGCPSSSYARPSKVKLNWDSGMEKVYSAYYYRGEGGGSSLEIERAMPALVMDFNVNDSKLYNHRGEHVNILFTDGSVKGFADSGLVLDRKIAVEVDRVFSAADRMREEFESE